MGSISNYDRCNKYIDEFNEDAVRKYGLRKAALRQSLNIDEGTEEVFLYAVIDDDGEDRRVRVETAPTPFFNPDTDFDDLVVNAVYAFDIPKEEAIKRLKRAGLDA